MGLEPGDDRHCTRLKMIRCSCSGVCNTNRCILAEIADWTVLKHVDYAKLTTITTCVRQVLVSDDEGEM